jgi:transcriptional regulator with XRE-family HTH domain
MTATGEGHTLGEKVRAAREARRMTQDQLARKAGLSRDYVGKIERDERKRPGLEAIAALAGVLEMSVDDMIDPRALVAPDPFFVEVGERIDALPWALQRTARRLIAEDVAALEAPYLGYVAALGELLGETTELSEAELQQVAEFALRLVHQDMTAVADSGASATAQ